MSLEKAEAIQEDFQLELNEILKENSRRFSVRAKWNIKRKSGL